MVSVYPAILVAKLCKMMPHVQIRNDSDVHMQEFRF